MLRSNCLFLSLFSFHFSASRYIAHPPAPACLFKLNKTERISDFGFVKKSANEISTKHKKCKYPTNEIYRLRNKLGQRTSERVFLVWVFATSHRVYGS